MRGGARMVAFSLERRQDEVPICTMNVVERRMRIIVIVR